MAGSSRDERGLNDQLHPYVYRRLTNPNGVDRHVDGTAVRAGDAPLQPVPPPGNPYIDPETGERYPGAPGA